MSLSLSFLAMLALLAAILYTANCLLTSTLAIAHRMNISPFLASVLLLGFGTSSPEYFISVLAAIQGQSLLALGNVFGSNITNLTFVCGCCALMAKLCISRATLYQRFTLVLVSTIIPGYFISDLYFSRNEGFILLICFIFLLYYMIRLDKQTQEVGDEHHSNNEAPPSVKHPWLQAIVSLIVMLICCDIVVRLAVDVATGLGISPYVIGVTIIAFGTSLPELVSAMVSLYRKSASMAIGTILGSNIFNSFGIFGSVSAISPTVLGEDVFYRDLVSMFGATLLLGGLFVLSKTRCIGRIQGSLLMLYFIMYLVWLLTTSQAYETIDI